MTSEKKLTGYPSIDKPWLKYYSEEAKTTEIPEIKSVYENIKEKNELHKNKIAIKYYRKRFTYEELFSKVDEYASRFKILGVNSGDIVSICMPSTPETVFAIYALNKIGAICDMIDPRSNSEQMRYYLKENQSKLLVLCANYYGVMKPAIDNSNLKKTILFPAIY